MKTNRQIGTDIVLVKQRISQCRYFVFLSVNLTRMDFKSHSWYISVSIKVVQSLLTTMRWV